jgi:hypothetical protein
MDDNRWCIVRGRAKIGTIVYVSERGSSSTPFRVVRDGTTVRPALLDASSEADVGAALRAIKGEAWVDHLSVEVIFLRPVASPLDDQERSETLQRLGIANLCKTEIEALGLVDRMIYHKLLAP